MFNFSKGINFPLAIYYLDIMDFKFAKELINALLAIAKAIKGDDKNNGGGNSNDNGLYGADGIIVVNGYNPEQDNKVFLSQKELIDDFKENVDKYTNGAYGRTIKYLYTENNIDKLFKPTEGIIGKTYQVASDQFQFSTNFLNEYSLEYYQLVSIQDYLEGGQISESDVEKITEKLGNNVYVFKYTTWF